VSVILKSCPRAMRVVICLAILACGANAGVAQSLPAPWANRDIGSPPAAGSAVESGGTFSVRGAGYDIWYTHDQFHFVYQRVTGDVDIRAHITGLEYVHPWTKAAVMIRESFNVDSRHASTFVSAERGLSFQRRVWTGGSSTSTAGGSAGAPYWVRIVRAGQLFTSYVSADGASWKLVGTETIAMASTVYVGLAVVSKDPGNTVMASFTNVTVGASGSTTPSTSTWTNADIGNPALAGRGSVSSGTYSVTGGGADIWNTSDQFHFMHQRASGDMEMIARVGSIGYANAWSKAGVMIREALTASSEHAFMLGSAGKGWAFQTRPVAGGLSEHSPGPPGTAPGWVKLVRIGNTFSGYHSSDGTNWVLVGTETISMPLTVYVGLAVTSHNVSATSTATFTNVTLRGPSSSNKPPSITLTAPATNSIFTAPINITLAASASDSDGTVSRVTFFANGNQVGSDTSSPYGATWSSVPAGTHNLTAVATDNGGATTTSGTATITVKSATGTATRVVFNPSPDHSTAVTSYSVALRRAGDSTSATPVASKNLGKPTPVNNEIQVDISDIVNPLASGSYYAVVTAVGPGGSSASTPSAAFTK
jgi:regulation of enolase protein 1 (concanavalin A-like superfamily)